MTADGLVAFHVGAHKTGTSLLQRYLDDHADVLERRGIGLVTRTELSDYVRWGAGLVEDPEPLRRRIDQVLRVHDVGAFGSNENIVGRPFVKGGGGRLYPDAARNIAALAGILRGCRPLLFLSIRPQHEFLESYYLQTVHQGSAEPFHQWLTRIDLAALSWRPLVDALLAEVGPEGFELVDFRLIERGQETYIRHFLARLAPGFDEPIDYPQPVNRSISARGLDIALAVNPLLEGDEYRALRKFLQRNFSNVDQPRPRLLGDEERQELVARYQEEYDELVGRYGRPTTAALDAVDQGRQP